MTTVPPPPGTPLAGYRFDRWRYLRIVLFFGRIAGLAIGWYMVVQPVLGRGFVRRGETARLRGWARQFRQLAVRMGGVLIKLGQFVSSRVDVLPPEIIEELTGLQDEVPPVPFARMEASLRAALGPAWRDLFAAFEQDVVAAASFGQAYRAQLRAEDGTPGDRVVVKVQRPGIEDTVHTDLRALGVVARLAMRFRFIRRRANVPVLLDEFARVLWEELDYDHEAANADRFAALYADDYGVYIPAVYHTHSSRRVLMLEDVTAIKLNDYPALEAAGIDRAAVAQRLLDTYLTQVFVYHFFHADPHPGNIFIYPLPEDAAGRSKERADHGRAFYIVFIDFGMTAHLSPELASGLRETLLGLLTRDSKRLVTSYQRLGVLLPGADLKRIEAANEAVFNQVWGLNMTELMGMDYAVMRNIGREFSDLLFSMPFQVPQDFIYLGRAVGILSGMCTGLDPSFDPWRAIQPFARGLLTDESPGGTQANDWRKLLNWETVRAFLTPETVGLAVSTGQDVLTHSLTLPARVDNALGKLERGELLIGVSPDEHFDRHLRRLERIASSIVMALVFGSLIIAASLLYITGAQGMALAGYILAGITLVGLLIRSRV